jgi:hypothetical protein
VRRSAAKQVPVAVLGHPAGASEVVSQARRSGSRSGSRWSTIRATSVQSAPSFSASSRRR